MPIHSSPAGTSLVTTLPAAMNAFSPMVIPGRITLPAPMVAPLHTLVFSNVQSLFFDLGNISLVKVTFEPIITLSSSVMPSQTCTPHLMVTLFPISTSFSIRQCEQILQFSPILHFGNTTQNYQILVLSGTFWFIQSANLCIIYLLLFL